MIPAVKLRAFAEYVCPSEEEFQWEPDVYMRTLMRDMALEILAAREVVEAARELIDSLNPMFIETDAVIVKLHDALKNLEDARRG